MHRVLANRLDWPYLAARPATEDGSVLVPDAPELVTQVINVRDLPRWLVEAGSRGVCGIFNATGETVLLRQHLEVARNPRARTAPAACTSTFVATAHRQQLRHTPRQPDRGSAPQVVRRWG